MFDLLRLESMMLRLTIKLGILKSLWLTASTLPFGPFWNFKVILMAKYCYLFMIHLCGGGVFTQIGIIIPAFLGGSLLFSIGCQASLQIKYHLITRCLPCGNSRQVLLFLSRDYSVVHRLSLTLLCGQLVLYVWSGFRLILELLWCLRTVCRMMS